jgi:hypothetical protein
MVGRLSWRNAVRVIVHVVWHLGNDSVESLNRRVNPWEFMDDGGEKPRDMLRPGDVIFFRMQESIYITLWSNNARAALRLSSLSCAFSSTSFSLSVMGAPLTLDAALAAFAGTSPQFAGCINSVANGANRTCRDSGRRIDRSRMIPNRSSTTSIRERNLWNVGRSSP